MLLTEEKAWEFTKKLFESNLKKDSDGEVFVNFGASGYLFGICDVIEAFYVDKMIDFNTRVSMENKIKTHPEYSNTFSYIWPLTLYGANLRVEFCQQQIEKLQCSKN